MKSLHKQYIILLTITLIPFINGNAQDSLFGRIQVGTQSSTSPFEGASFDVNFGIKIKGLEIGLAINNYINRWGKNELETLQIDQYDDYDYIAVSNRGKNNTRFQNFGLYASIGYDLLSLVRQNRRHHLSPLLELGYSHKTSYSKSENIMPGLSIFEVSAQTESDFEMSMGCRYEFDITKNISVGAFYKIYLLCNEMDLMGLSFQYQIPLR